MTRTKKVVTPEKFEPFSDAKIISGPQLGVTLCLVIAGLLPLLGAAWIVYELHPFQLDAVIAIVLLATLVFAVIETFAIIILWGMKRLDLPHQFAHWLGVATIGELGTLTVIIVKKLFH